MCCKGLFLSKLKGLEHRSHSYASNTGERPILLNQARAVSSLQHSSFEKSSDFGVPLDSRLSMNERIRTKEEQKKRKCVR